MGDMDRKSKIGALIAVYIIVYGLTLGFDATEGSTFAKLWFFLVPFLIFGYAKATKGNE